LLFVPEIILYDQYSNGRMTQTDDNPGIEFDFSGANKVTYLRMNSIDSTESYARVYSGKFEATNNNPPISQITIFSGIGTAEFYGLTIAGFSDQTILVLNENTGIQSFLKASLLILDKIPIINTTLTPQNQLQYSISTVNGDNWKTGSDLHLGSTYIGVRIAGENSQTGNTFRCLRAFVLNIQVTSTDSFLELPNGGNIINLHLSKEIINGRILYLAKSFDNGCVVNIFPASGDTIQHSLQFSMTTSTLQLVNVNGNWFTFGGK